MKLATSLALLLVLAVVSAVAAQPRTPATPGQPLIPGQAAPRPTGPVPAAPAVRSAPDAGSPSALPAPQPQTGATLPLSSEYVIGPGDVLQVTVWKNDTLSRMVPVRPDGKISMPLLHDIQAAGLTAMQLRDKIAKSLAEFLPNPEVAVSVNEVHSMRISVLGEVQRPGVLELRGTTTILEALAMAGGFRDFASPSKITVIRTDANGQTQRLRFNYNRAVGNAGDEQNLVLKPGDVVVVP
ncbi:MAG: polysaccharide biosynthesis/export family protein [Candidatus Rokuibacteriota bacterium]